MLCWINQEDSDENSTKYVNMKQISEPLTWFGMLVSPHLRGAESSFKEGNLTDYNILGLCCCLQKFLQWCMILFAVAI